MPNQTQFGIPCVGRTAFGAATAAKYSYALCQPGPQAVLEVIGFQVDNDTATVLSLNIHYGRFGTLPGTALSAAVIMQDIVNREIGTDVAGGSFTKNGTDAAVLGNSYGIVSCEPNTRSQQHIFYKPFLLYGDEAAGAPWVGARIRTLNLTNNPITWLCREWPIFDDTANPFMRSSAGWFRTPGSINPFR